MIRRTLAILLVLICIAVTAVAWLWLRAGRQGEGELERWVASQIVQRAQMQLNPTLSFGELDYQYPTTVVMRDLKLTADDPRVAGSKVDVIAAGEAVITLAELPGVGRPLVVERISLYRPAVRLIKVDSQTGPKGFAGLSGMIKRSADVSTTQPTTRTAHERLKQALSINRVELIDGRIEYDPRIDNTPPMILDQITAVMQIQPTSDGQYRVQTNLGRKPIAESSLKGLIDLDSMRLTELEVAITANIDGSRADFLPPELQRILRKYEAKGLLQVNATGDFSLADPSVSQLSGVMTLASANLSMGVYRFPLDRLNCSFKLGNGQMQIEQLRVRGLQGELFLEGAVEFTASRDATFAITARDLDLKELIDSDARSDTSLSGTLNGGMRLEVPTRVIRAKMRAMRDPASTSPLAGEPWPPRWGMGTVEISNGHLMTLPVISQLNQAVSSTLNLGRTNSHGRERLTLNFEMNEDRINFGEIIYMGSGVAGRGTGHITLDQRIDLQVNGGPVEKMQSMLGKTVGGMMGRVTDSLAGYRVSGTLKEPQVSLEVAPGLFGIFPGTRPGQGQ